MKEAMTNISLTQSRFIVLVTEVFKQSVDTANFKHDLGDSIAICTTLTLQLLEDATEHATFISVMEKVSENLSKLSYSAVGELDLKNIVELRAMYPKIFFLLNDELEYFLEEKNFVEYDSFVTEIVFACVIWGLIHCNEEEIKEYLLDTESSIRFEEMEDGSVSVLFLNKLESEDM